jgi:hypothetical protein
MVFFLKLLGEMPGPLLPQFELHTVVEQRAFPGVSTLREAGMGILCHKPF